ncbi:MAG: EF-hand domain-containing protein [archaeon]|nr:EF-hand domain-containing protein [archaeon]
MASQEDIDRTVEFIKVIKDRFSPENFKQAFDTEDKDGSGFLEVGELKTVCANILKQLFPEEEGFDPDSQEGIEQIEDMVKKILEDFDVNGDGKIELVEFKKIMLLLLISLMPKLAQFENEEFEEFVKAAKANNSLPKDLIPLANEILRAVHKYDF